ncbi:hypothetical protein K488DRAFT_43415 [Vararia minispora EC-137]|uniref:Uncharacterized protein n=1 Tax=Vararia minispora EC-137 TaxID=1314806 RepID=A0ACB8QV80_9AGAM|nr:hypothetical protein K488DRAFT_43415 [Vararia minispora EC-137]
MAPFHPPRLLATGVKERIEAVTRQADRLYLGTSTGSLYVYGFEHGLDAKATLIETKKGISRRAIEQLGYVKDINSLVILSAEMQVTLLSLPDLSSPTPLPKAKAAFSFAVHTFVEHSEPDIPRSPRSSPGGKRMTVPTVVTHLLIGCRRKMVLYSWRDGDAQEVKEATLPHSARTIAFLNDSIVSLSYDTATHVLFSLETMSTTEISMPPAPSTSGAAISTLGKGLGGYMTLGLGAKSKPCATNVGDNEVLIAKDNEGAFVGPDGRPSRTVRIDWPAPPDEIAFVKPYIFSLLPSGTVPSKSPDVAPAFISSPVVQIHSSISISAYQTISFPFDAEPSGQYSIRLLTPSTNAGSPLFVTSTPTDRTQAVNDGSTIWMFAMKPWTQQLDELVNDGKYGEALALLETLDTAVLPDKASPDGCDDRRKDLIQGLDAVARFRAGNHNSALDTFIALNINPAKVVALYPESVAGRLSTPQDRWFALFGGPSRHIEKESQPNTTAADELKLGNEMETSSSGLSKTTFPSSGSIMSKFISPLDAIRPSSAKDSETASITTTARKAPPADDFSRSVESLLRYLPDRRVKIAAALEAFNITPAQAHRHTSLSEASLEELLAMPDSPLRSLTPEQLIRCAQIVDTALFKSYLIIRPGLLGPLCRRDNWCEVIEMEGLLLDRGSFSELIDLYNGKKMHSKALELLQKLSEKEADMEDKLRPSILYLQRLGPEHLDQIFKYSKWVLEQNADHGFEIFTSEEVVLPKAHVASFLENLDPKLCARYLEFLITERGEESADYHNRLVELYLKMTKVAKKSGNQEEERLFYDKLLHFIDTTDQYRIDRLFGLLPSDDMFEAKAILLGRLGRHGAALELYVYKLRDYAKAEEYCKRVYVHSDDTDDIFLTLLRIYLRPLVKTPDDLLTPALALIARHSLRLDPEATLQLLPPLVRAQDVRAFLISALRQPVFDTKTVCNISKARSEQVARRLMYLESNRVRVTNTRICPQCHKRIGPSIISVHAPGGEVTHYHCREPFAKKLKEMRHS